MSIKTIDRPIKGSAGVAKKINKGAEKMVFDILQSTQYSMPIASTIRELVTNACDSQREKEIALEILKGEKVMEDYYIERGGEQYEDSNFDKTYYDLDKLNQDTNTSVLTYEEHTGTGYCDTFKVRDNGVGIGGRRLEGVLELGYSTKRNTSENFGAFGLGAKSALSTGVDFYTIETVHNGKRFKCNCYNYKTDFIIPAFNVKEGKPNPHIILTTGDKVYYEETSELNYTEVSFGTKRHNRSKFREAIEEQLSYIDNVEFFIEDHEEEEVYSRQVHFKANVVYNTDNLIISDYSTYSKPHIVVVKNKAAVTGINYGYVDFRELEMEQLYGPIAFKCPIRQVVMDDYGIETVLQEGVDVTPSREKVIWNETTKRYVEGVIKSASDEATELVQKELNETDFLAWILKCRSVIAGSTEDPILEKLGRIIDKSMIKPTFPGDKRIRYHIPSRLFEGFKLTKLSYKSSNGKGEVSRHELMGWDGFDAKHVYFKDEVPFSRLTDAFIMNVTDTWNHNSVVVLTKDDVDAKFLPKISGATGTAKAALQKEHNRVKAKHAAVMVQLTKSAMYHSYDEVEVPEDWEVEFKQVEVAATNYSVNSGLSPAERREVNKTIVAYTLREDDRRNDDKNYTWDKVEPKLKDLMVTDNRIYYGTKADEEELHIAAELLRDMAPTHSGVYPSSNHASWSDHAKEPIYFYDSAATRFTHRSGENAGKPWTTYQNMVSDTWDTPQLLRISEDKVKLMKKGINCKHISEFFLQSTPNNGFTMDDSLISWYTASKLEDIKDYDFLHGMKALHPELKEVYDRLRARKDDTYSTFRFERIRKTAVMTTVEKVFQFQEYCESIKDVDDKAALIEAKSAELFILSDVGESVAVNMKEIAEYGNLREFADEVKPLLSYIERLTQYEEMTPELEKEILIYLKAKDRDTWETLA